MTTPTPADVAAANLACSSALAYNSEFDALVASIATAIAAAREAAADIAHEWTKPQSVRLYCGELTSDEVAIARAVAGEIERHIRAWRPT